MNAPEVLAPPALDRRAAGPALLLLVVFPAVLDVFRLNLVGKYLSYAFVAVGLVVLWGWGGVLSLGQGCSSASAATPWPCS